MACGSMSRGQCPPQKQSNSCGAGAEAPKVGNLAAQGAAPARRSPLAGDALALATPCLKSIARERAPTGGSRKGSCRWIAENGSADEAPHRVDHVRHGEAEVIEQLRRGGRGAEGVNPAAQGAAPARRSPLAGDALALATPCLKSIARERAPTGGSRKGSCRWIAENGSADDALHRIDRVRHGEAEEIEQLRRGAEAPKVSTPPPRAQHRPVGARSRAMLLLLLPASKASPASGLLPVDREKWISR